MNFDKYFLIKINKCPSLELYLKALGMIQEISLERAKIVKMAFWIFWHPFLCASSLISFLNLIPFLSPPSFLGIEYLYENGLLKHDPKDVAQFLYKGEGLNKTAIGKE